MLPVLITLLGNMVLPVIMVTSVIWCYYAYW